MKWIKLYEEFLGDNINEGLSSVLYHATSLIGAESILRQDRFQLANIVATKAERRLQKEFYFISFARSLTSEFTRFLYPSTGDVIFKIDGDSLSKNYKGSPVNYWSGTSKRELEDRLVLDTPIIEGAKRFIQEIYIYVGGKDSNNEIGFLSESEQSFIRKIVISAKKSDIPVFIYKRQIDLISRNKANSISVEDLDLSGQYWYRYNINWESKANPWLFLLYKMYITNKKEELIQSLTATEKEKLENFYVDIPRGYTSIDMEINYVKNVILDIERNIDSLSKTNSSISNKIISIMKREGWKSIEEFFNAMKEKWQLEFFNSVEDLNAM